MKRWILPLTLAAGLALAGTLNITDTYVFQALFKPWSRTTAQLPTASAWTGYQAFDSTKGALTVSNGSAWVSSPFNELGPVSASYDFPVLGAGAANCADTSAVALAGAAISDFCGIAANFGADGGAGLSIEVSISCNVTAAGVVKGRACAARADAGTVDLPDAGYTYRVFH